MKNFRDENSQQDKEIEIVDDNVHESNNKLAKTLDDISEKSIVISKNESVKSAKKVKKIKIFM